MKKSLILSVLMALVLSACLPEDTQIPQSPLLSTLERKAGLIAYIGIDGNIYVSDQAGGKLQQLTDDAASGSQAGEETVLYQLPTWSLDGTQLAYVGTRGNSMQATAQIFVANIATETSTAIYTSEAEFPFYLHWSPDGQTVSFLTTTVSGQSLILQHAPVDGSGRVILDTGSPIYWSWAPDGQTLIVHAGGANDSTVPEHIAFLQLQDSGIIEQGLDVIPASFQAPAWSPDGSRIVLTRAEDGKRNIILTDTTGAFEKTLGSFELNTAFGWSNDSRKVAFISGEQSMNAGAIGPLTVVDIETDEELTVGETVIAFFWSPDSTKLAYYIPFIATPEEGGTQQLYLQLNMLDMATGESKELFSYQPTEQFSRILPYFDQYNQSNTIWSPDNNNLVLSFLDNQGNPGIAIVAASGQLEPRLLTNGYLAFWSWR
jgi:TolB protein